MAVTRKDEMLIIEHEGEIYKLPHNDGGAGDDLGFSMWGIPRDKYDQFNEALLHNADEVIRLGAEIRVDRLRSETWAGEFIDNGSTEEVFDRFKIPSENSPQALKTMKGLDSLAGELAVNQLHNEKTTIFHNGVSLEAPILPKSVFEDYNNRHAENLVWAKETISTQMIAQGIMEDPNATAQFQHISPSNQIQISHKGNTWHASLNEANNPIFFDQNGQEIDRSNTAEMDKIYAAVDTDNTGFQRALDMLPANEVPNMVAEAAQEKPAQEQTTSTPAQPSRPRLVYDQKTVELQRALGAADESLKDTMTYQKGGQTHWDDGLRGNKTEQARADYIAANNLDANITDDAIIQHAQELVAKREAEAGVNKTGLASADQAVPAGKDPNGVELKNAVVKEAEPVTTTHDPNIIIEPGAIKDAEKALARWEKENSGQDIPAEGLLSVYERGFGATPILIQKDANDNLVLTQIHKGNDDKFIAGKTAIDSDLKRDAESSLNIDEGPDSDRDVSETTTQDITFNVKNGEIDFSNLEFGSADKKYRTATVDVNGTTQIFNVASMVHGVSKFDKAHEVGGVLPEADRGMKEEFAKSVGLIGEKVENGSKLNIEFRNEAGETTAEISTQGMKIEIPAELAKAILQESGQMSPNVNIDTPAVNDPSKFGISA